jgi:septum formation protein
MQPRPTILLASASPRRRDLLTAAGLEVIIQPAHIDEVRLAGEHPVHLARRLATSKARTAQARYLEATPAGAVLPALGADTVVHARDPGQGPFGATIFDKPVDRADAVAILSRLSDRWHAVTTGYCIVHGETQLVEHVTTRVRFRALSPALIDLYVATGEPMDKAGAYGIQGQGAVLVARVEGSYTNVVGLPLEAVASAMRRLGIGGSAR